MKKLIIPLILCILLTGCYDSHETDELAFVVAMGIDKGTDKAFNVTFQYAVPLNISPDGGDSKPVYSLNFETDSILNCVLMASSKISKVTDLSHLSLIVFSEEIAKMGILPLKDDLAASVKTVPDAFLAVCKGNAKDCLVAISSPLELNPAKFYRNFFEDESSSPYTVKQTAIEFFNGKSDFALPCLIYGDSVSVNGMAAFKNGKLTALFSKEEALIYNLLKNKYSDVLIETENAVYRVNSELPPKYSVDIKDLPLIKITLSLSGEAKTGNYDILKDTKRAKADLTDCLKKQIVLFLNKTKKEDCDILSLSSHAKRKFLTEKGFSAYKWQKKYKNAEFQINITFKNSKNNHGG